MTWGLPIRLDWSAGKPWRCSCLCLPWAGIKSKPGFLKTTKTTTTKLWCQRSNIGLHACSAGTCSTDKLSYVLTPSPVALSLPRLSHSSEDMSEVSGVYLCKCSRAPCYPVSQADKVWKMGAAWEMLWDDPPGTALVWGPTSPFFVVKDEVGNLQRSFLHIRLPKPLPAGRGISIRN